MQSARRALTTAGSTAKSLASRTGKFAKGILSDGVALTKGAVTTAGDVTADLTGLFTGGSVMSGAICAALVIYSVFVVNQLPDNALAMVTSTIGRLAIVLLILAMAISGEHAGAILLTVAFILTIQAANKQAISKFANLAVTGQGDRETFYGSSSSCMKSSRTKEYEDTFANHGHGEDVPYGEEYDAPQPPAHTTANPAAPATTFTTAQQFDSIQTNQVSTTNQDTEVRTWKEELGPQGLTQPAGCAGQDSSPAPFSMQ